MVKDHRKELHEIRTFPSLIRYLRDEMGWPIDSDDFEDLTYEYSPEELGIDEKNAAKIQCIKRLRPLVSNQPWGIFFVKFEPKQLPVVALRRILSKVVVKKRASANQAEQVSWSADDLLFVSNYGESDKRTISFAHFAQGGTSSEIPRLKVLGWDNLDTPLHLDDVADKLTNNLSWPEDDCNQDVWRKSWRSAFTIDHREIITTAQRLSIRLAELAQSVRDRIKSALEIESEDGPLKKLMDDFQKALIQDLNKNSFADMYAQTIAYGLLSMRIAYPKSKTAEDLTKHIHTSPFLHEIMTSFMKAGGLQGKGGRSSIDFDELGISEVIELLDSANMEAVLRDFGDRNPQEDPVIHFYESFLSHYDAESRMKRGVFYTPKPVVSFIVRSVDELLKTEFGLEDGLADVKTWGEMVENNPGVEIPAGVSGGHPFVQILDPATGTGTFLVEVIDLIYKNMVAKWSTQGHGAEAVKKLWNEYVPKHLLPRLHGFELLMAPYAIAHLKVGLKLYETGYRFEKNERVRVYLTNALEPGDAEKQMQMDILPALANEFIEVNLIKSKGCFTVVIGNPPYSNMSANLTDTARSLVTKYKYIDGQLIKEKNSLQLERNVNDDYVKFMSLGESIVNNSSGIMAFITNASYIDANTLRGLRYSLISTFERIKIIDLGGSTDLSGTSLSNEVDQNVFDISQPVAISIFCKLNDETYSEYSYYRVKGDIAEKYCWLLNTVCNEVNWDKIEVSPDAYYLVRINEGKGWNVFTPIDSCLGIYAEGLKTGFDKALISFSENELHDTISLLKDTNYTTEMLHEFFSIKKSGWALQLISQERNKLSRSASFAHYVTQIPYRPLDLRWTPWGSSLLKASSKVAGKHLQNRDDNVALIVARQVTGCEDVSHFFVSRRVPDARIFYSKKGTASYFPVYHEQLGSFYKTDFIKSICSSLDLVWQDEELNSVDDSVLTPLKITAYIYSIFYSLSYRVIYKDRLKLEFPRIPLTTNKDLFKNLSELGSELICVHLMENNYYNHFCNFECHCIPEVVNIDWSENTVWLDCETKKYNDIKKGTYGFKGVTEDIWRFQIGGYQISHKWLKDRKKHILTKDEINHYIKIINTISETIRIMREIDELIESYGGWSEAFVIE